MVVGALLVASWYSKDPTFMVPEGRIKILRADRIDYVIREKGLACLKCTADSGRPEPGAVCRHKEKDWRRTFDSSQLGADEIEPKIVELLLGQALARKAPAVRPAHWKRCRQ